MMPRSNIFKRLRYYRLHVVGGTTLAIWLMAGCASSPATLAPTPVPAGAVLLSDVDTSVAQEQVLKDGFDLLMNFDPQAAVAEFDKLILQCDKQFKDSPQQVYASRSLQETLYYLSLAGASNTDAIAVDSLCSQALYLKAYANIELDDVDGAEQLLERAIALSPANPTYLSELGHIYHMRSHWQKSLVLFEQAEEFAERFSPPDLQMRELTRAKRGVAYSLIELGNLDAAEQKFNECLVLDPQDEASQRELEYIRSARAKSLLEE